MKKPTKKINHTFNTTQTFVYRHEAMAKPAETDLQKCVEAAADSLGIQTEMGKLAFKSFCEAAVLLDSKQRDYGSGNISSFGEKGVIVRMNDKVERLKTLVWQDREPSHEKVSDTWLDITNYGVIGLLCHRGDWK
jgi:hypothetical protein